jgi:hypothetical protein
VELRQLKAFVAVATEGHFGRAAARLNLTQPGLTLRIQALEKEALEAVARSNSLVTFANGSRATSAPVPGIAYRPIAPAMFIDFGIAYFRDADSPAIANLLGLIDEMAADLPGDLPEGSELLEA